MYRLVLALKTVCAWGPRAEPDSLSAVVWCPCSSFDHKWSSLGDLGTLNIWIHKRTLCTEGQDVNTDCVCFPCVIGWLETTRAVRKRWGRGVINEYLIGSSPTLCAVILMWSRGLEASSLSSALIHCYHTWPPSREHQCEYDDDFCLYVCPQ